MAPVMCHDFDFRVFCLTHELGEGASDQAHILPIVSIQSFSLITPLGVEGLWGHWVVGNNGRTDRHTLRGPIELTPRVTHRGKLWLRWSVVICRSDGWWFAPNTGLRVRVSGSQGWRGQERQPRGGGMFYCNRLL